MKDGQFADATEGLGGAAETDMATQDKWPRFVNAYRINRRYGGPEEGGWWYDTGQLLASIPCHDHIMVEMAQRLMADAYGVQF